jgi:D-alanyl-D-alanine carboxypeptidase
MSRSLLLRSLVLLLVCLLPTLALARGKGKVRRAPPAKHAKAKPAKKRFTRVPGGESLRTDVAGAFQKMIAAAREEGIFLWANSGYRTVAEQRRLYRLFRRGKGPKAARPGRSNHHQGIAVDIPVGGDESSANYTWLAAHACRFGFLRTVPTEPWHWEFRPQFTSPPEEGFDCLGRSLSQEEPVEQTLTEETAQETPPPTDATDAPPPVPIFLDPVLVRQLEAMNPV